MWVKQLTVVSEPNEDRMGVISIDLDFFEDGELGIEFSGDKLGDFFMSATFLSKELIAGESQYLKASIFPLLMSLHHLCVVIGSESSFAGDVGDHDEFPI